MFQREIRRQTQPAKGTPEPAAFSEQTGIPNEAMLAFWGVDDQAGDQSAILDSILSRIDPSAHLQPQIPSAEQEADRLSASVRGTGQADVKAAMRQRLGGDFSDVRFHTDREAALLADSMGARAFTAGRDVYFGTGGFAPDVAAHELVHTAQQGAVEAAGTTVSAPMGGVQQKPSLGSRIANWFRSHFHRKENDSAPQQWKSGSVEKYRSEALKRLKKAGGLSKRKQEALKETETERMEHWAEVQKELHSNDGAGTYAGQPGLKTYSDDRNYRIMNGLSRGIDMVGKQLVDTDSGLFRLTSVTAGEAKEMAKANSQLQKSMTEGLYTGTTQDMVVHRGGDEAVFTGINRDGKTGAELSRLIAGQVMMDPAFGSTSLSKEIADRFANGTAERSENLSVIHALLPKGAKAQYMASVSEFADEEEMLLPQNTPMRVLKSEMKKRTVGSKEKAVHNVYGEYLPFAIGQHRTRPNQGTDALMPPMVNGGNDPIPVPNRPAPQFSPFLSSEEKSKQESQPPMIVSASGGMLAPGIYDRETGMFLGSYEDGDASEEEESNGAVPFLPFSLPWRRRRKK